MIDQEYPALSAVTVKVDAGVVTCIVAGAFVITGRTAGLLLASKR